jgi:hypothetical protein
MTYPYRGNPALPNPFLQGTQWQHGEPINDVKLHQRIDEPLNNLALPVQSHGKNWPSFLGVKTGSITLSAGLGVGAEIPWTVVEDTHSGWNSLLNFWTPPINGRYMITLSVAQSTAVSFRALLCGNNQSDGGQINDGMFPFESPNAEPIAGGGCQISTVMTLFTFFDICAVITATVTALSADSCYLRIQMLGGWI